MKLLNYDFYRAICFFIIYINIYLKIVWRHDGRLITPNVLSDNKYQVRKSGSLLVRDFTVADGGRYECTLKNQYGRATASALVKIK